MGNSSTKSNENSIKNTPIEINENAHSKIMRDMSSYLDECKNKKKDCQCSGVLEYNENETDDLKKWSFLYQCDDNGIKNAKMKKRTLKFLQNSDDYKEEVYKVNA